MRLQVDILKNRLATAFTVQKIYRADFFSLFSPPIDVRESNESTGRYSQKTSRYCIYRAQDL